MILLDIGLPKLSGIEAARQIRKSAPHSRILFVSQESSPEVVQEALSLGTCGYVVKSKAEHDLLATVPKVRTAMTYAERYATGKALRERSPRKAHADWKAPYNRRDAVQQV